MSSSVTATRRTRATSHSPSTPAAARAGSGRCQSSCTRAERCSFVRRLFVGRRLWTSTRPLSICTYGHVRGRRHRAAVSALFTVSQCSLRTERHKRGCAYDQVHIPGRSFWRASACTLRVAASPVLSARCVDAATAASTSSSRRYPTHLGLPQGELLDARAWAAHACSGVATQSLQTHGRRALPPQRIDRPRRNFALDLPLVA